MDATVWLLKYVSSMPRVWCKYPTSVSICGIALKSALIYGVEMDEEWLVKDLMWGQ